MDAMQGSSETTQDTKSASKSFQGKEMLQAQIALTKMPPGQTALKGFEKGKGCASALARKQPHLSWPQETHLRGTS